ncbi:zinc finger protein ZFP2-like [Paramacrobiotus metropolitanus]|uniref:zinc finger protein ZFP2-like n=1 Tax=Paramacrobiotus metropolitanus TaxID=2943436 RepID=UPI002445994E|nr:zinc finger protein ZFP2-like [Paramacrobiotus metropolitanus]
MPFSRVYSLRGRNVVRAGAACSDGDFSEDNDENFSLAGKSDSSTTDSEYCTEVEDVLEDSTTKKRGRKRRMVDARDTVRPHKIVAVNPVIGKDSVMPDVCSPKVRSYARTKLRAEDMRRLNAVVKINPFQFSGSRERRAAWTAVWEAYRADYDTSDKRKAQKVLLSCRSLQKYVRCQLRNFPNMLDRYNENNANQAEREFIAVMRVMAQRAGKDYADDAHPLAMHKNAVGVATLSAAVDTQNAHSTLRSNRKRPNSRYVSYVYRFVCWECSMHFKDESLLNLHKMQHSGATPVSLDCPACQRTFTKVSNLFRHVMDHGVKASQIVHFIPTADPSILSFASSTAAPMDVLPQSHGAHETCFMYTCGLAQCGLRFCTETMADLHQLSHNVPDDYQGDVVCSGCNYVAANAEDLLKHVGRHAAQATDRKLCRLCGEFVENMVVHVRTNHKEEYFKYEAGLALSCDQCETRLRTSDHLATHKLWAHKGEQGRLGCLVCAKPFPSTRQLHAHVQKEHTTGLTCVVCQKRYSRYDRLHQHAKTHKEIYICPTCGSVFRSKRSLVQHQPVHQSDYSFRCDLCGKSFKRSTNLSQHKIVVHTDQVRKKRKAQREEMRRKGVVSEYKCPRQRMRYEEFPYKCEECRLGWMLLGNLQQHQRKKHSQGDATVKNGTSHSVSSSDGNT